MPNNKTLLLAGSFADKGALELQYKRGFTKQSWDVITHEIVQPLMQLRHRSMMDKVASRVVPSLYLKSINQKLLQRVKDLKPAVILIFKGMQLFPETIAALKNHTKLLCNYNADHPLKIYSRGGTNQYVIDSVPLYDVFFTYSKKITDRIIAEQKIAAHCIPFGFNSALNEQYATGAGWDQIADFAFIGAWDKTREDFFNQLNRPDVSIYGDAEWGRRSRSSLVKQIFKNKKLYGEGFYQCIRNAAANINLLREQNIAEASHNMRTFEVPGYGGLMLSLYTDEQAEFFEPDKEAVYFRSLEELRLKMDDLKNAPQLVKRIRKAAYAKSQAAGYSYDHRAAQMLQFINQYLNYS